jgi:hypothetical protein
VIVVAVFVVALLAVAVMVFPMMMVRALMTTLRVVIPDTSNRLVHFLR